MDRGAGARSDGGELLAQAGAGLVGIDAPSIDEEPYPVHRHLLGEGILIAENLCGLERLGPGPVAMRLLATRLVRHRRCTCQGDRLALTTGP